MTYQQKGALIFGLAGFSLLPIWRMAAGGRGLNFWEYLGSVLITRAGGASFPHLTTEEAIEKARKAYCQLKGLDYEQSYSDHFPIGSNSFMACRT